MLLMCCKFKIGSDKTSIVVNNHVVNLLQYDIYWLIDEPKQKNDLFVKLQLVFRL